MRHAHSTASVLAVVDDRNRGALAGSWSEVLEAAVRPEFTVDTYFPRARRADPIRARLRR